MNNDEVKNNKIEFSDSDPIPNTSEDLDIKFNRIKEDLDKVLILIENYKDK